MGQIYYLQENYDLAIQNFQKVIELEPELANGYFNLGVAYKKYGALTEARIALEKARKLLPENHKDIYRIDKELLGT